MEIEVIKAKQKELEQTFNKLEAQRKDLNKKVADIGEELLRLQGEYRAYGSIIELGASADAAVIDAEPTLKAEDKKVRSKK